MNNPIYERLKRHLISEPKVWLVTGVAGFIGSNLLETLLKLNQKVIGLDNLSTGHARNLAEVRDSVSPSHWINFNFIEGDLLDLDVCRVACSGANYVLHQAALGSVPRSIADPVETNKSNVDGFLNMLVASKDAQVKRFVYAASSSTYGDLEELPKREDRIGKPLSPYAVTKLVNELYADVFHRVYGLDSIGLRYFNVFGPRQDPDGGYAAVIPKWIKALLTGQDVLINGDGESSRDFCYVDNVVQANLLSAITANESAKNQIYNVAVGSRTTLNQLYEIIREVLSGQIPNPQHIRAIHRDFRSGDVRHSQANIDKAVDLLGYQPTQDLTSGLQMASGWYLRAMGL